MASNVFQEFDLDAEDFSNMDKCFHKIKVPFKKEFEKVVHNNYIQKTKDKLSELTDNSKLYLYNKIKHKKYCFGRVFDTGEKALKIDKPYKFRTRDHCLQIETGRYIYNTCALSKHMGNMCMRLRNAGKGFAEPFPAFRAEYTYLPICFDSAHVLYLSCNFKS